ncbi:MAG: acyl-CoA carboxylase subunit beta [Bacillota bacterium]
MSLKKKQQKLQDKKQKIRLGGGRKRIEKQHNKGKMTARERIDLLLDQDSFNELNMFAKNRSTAPGMVGREVPGEGVVTGYGTINRRLVFVFAQDFTVMGGSLGRAHARKIQAVMDLALKNGSPLIALNDSGGARIQEGVDALAGYGEVFYCNTEASGKIPQLAAVMGPCAGGAVYSPALMDFIFTVENTSRMFITGPEVIKTVTGEEISAEKLGGAKTHTEASGVAHFKEENEEIMLKKIGHLLSYIPDNYSQYPPRKETADDPGRSTSELLNVIEAEPKKAYNVKKVIKIIVDKNSFLEVHSKYAPNAVVGFARLHGRSVGIIANQPLVLAGCLDINASDKIARFIRFCDSFNIPLISLVDVPGYLPGVDQEQGGIIRHGAKVLYAYSEATVPKITLIMRKAYGGAYIAMGSQAVRADLVYAWPTAEIAVMGPEGAASVIYRKEIEKADNPDQLLAEKIKEYRESFANPYVAASRGMINGIIAVEKTRASLINGLEMLADKSEKSRDKKHGNIPQ